MSGWLSVSVSGFCRFFLTYKSSVPSVLCPVIYRISGPPLGTDDQHCWDLCVCILGEGFSIVSADTKKRAFHWFLVYPQRKMAVTSISTGSRFLFPMPLLKCHDALCRTSACLSTVQNHPTFYLLHQDHKFLLPVLDNLWIQTCETAGVLNNHIVCQKRTLFGVEENEIVF